MVLRNSRRGRLAGALARASLLASSTVSATRAAPVTPAPCGWNRADCHYQGGGKGGNRGIRSLREPPSDWTHAKNRKPRVQVPGVFQSNPPKNLRVVTNPMALRRPAQFQRRRNIM